MPEFLELLPPHEALEVLLSKMNPRVHVELVDTVNSLGRITAIPIVAPHPLPSFNRSTVDGYAVRASDTYGVSDSLPGYLRLIGEVPMGAEPGFSVSLGKCGAIHTGGMLPEGADAVVMIEHTQVIGENDIEVLKAVAIGENILKIGEDVASGEEVMSSGTRLRPSEIGGLMALGVTKLTVARKPKVGILSSGDEVVSPESEIAPGQVRDVNTYTLSALIEEIGGAPVVYGIVPDDFDVMFSIATRALEETDMLLISAGSSASTRDLTASIINRLGSPGVLVHGVNIRPGKPTILSICNGKAVIGLPGNPVSAFVIASLFVTPVVNILLGARSHVRGFPVRARLALNLPSQAGREDWVAVKLIPDHAEKGLEYLAEPVFGKSNLIFTLARADGLVRIPPNATGLSANEIVEVTLI